MTTRRRSFLLNIQGPPEDVEGAILWLRQELPTLGWLYGVKVSLYYEPGATPPSTRGGSQGSGAALSSPPARTRPSEGA